MVVLSDIHEGFSGEIEFPPVDAEFKSKCIAAVESAGPELLLESRDFRSELTLVVRKGKIREICRRLRDDADLQFNFLSDITAIDYLNIGREPRFDVVYHLYSIPNAWMLRLRAPVEEDECRIDSVCDVWPGADWNEREAYDFFGIVFEGHPNLERILMPEDWEGWPMRKDFPMGGTKSFYFKGETGATVGESKTLVPRIRKPGQSDV